MSGKISVEDRHESTLAMSTRGQLSSVSKPSSQQVAVPKNPPKTCPHSEFAPSPSPHGEHKTGNSNDGGRKRRAHSISGPSSSSSSPSPSSSSSQSHSSDRKATPDNQLLPPSPTMRHDMQRLQNLTIRSPVVTYPGTASAVALPSWRPSTTGQRPGNIFSSPLPAARPSPIGFHSPGCNSSFSPYTRNNTPNSGGTPGGSGNTDYTPQSPFVSYSRNDSDSGIFGSISGSSGALPASAVPLQSNTPPHLALARSSPSPRQVPLKILSNNQTPSLSMTSTSSSAKSPYFSRLLPPQKGIHDSPLIRSLDRIKDDDGSDDDDDDDDILFSPAIGSTKRHCSNEPKNRDVPHFISISSVTSSTSEAIDNQNSGSDDNDSHGASLHSHTFSSPPAAVKLKPFGQRRKFTLSPRKGLPKPPQSTTGPDAGPPSFPIVTPSPNSAPLSRPRTASPLQAEEMKHSGSANISGSSLLPKPPQELSSSRMPLPPRPKAPKMMMTDSFFANDANASTTADQLGKNNNSSDHDQMVGDEMNGLLQGFLNHKRQSQQEMKEPLFQAPLSSSITSMLPIASKRQLNHPPYQNLNHTLSQNGGSPTRNKESCNSLAFSVDSHSVENVGQSTTAANSCQRSHLASKERLTDNSKLALIPLRQSSTENIMKSNGKYGVPFCDQALPSSLNSEIEASGRLSSKENNPPLPFLLQSEDTAASSISCNRKISKKSQAKASSSHGKRIGRDRQTFPVQGTQQAKDVPGIQAKSLLIPSTSDAFLDALFAADAVADAASIDGSLSDSDDEDGRSNYFFLHAPHDICLESNMHAASSSHSLDTREKDEEEGELTRMPKQRRRFHQSNDAVMPSLAINGNSTNEENQSNRNRSDKAESNIASATNTNSVAAGGRDSDSNFSSGVVNSSSSSASLSSVDQSKTPALNGTITTATTRQQQPRRNQNNVKFSSTLEDHRRSSCQRTFSRSSLSRISSSSLFGMDIVHEDSQTLLTAKRHKESSDSLLLEDGHLLHSGYSSSGNLHRRFSDQSLNSLGLCLDGSSHSVDNIADPPRDLITPPIQVTHQSTISTLSPPLLKSRGPTNQTTVVTGLDQHLDTYIPQTNTRDVRCINYAKNCSVACAIADMEKHHGSSMI